MWSARVAVTLLCGLRLGCGADWPQYLGPNGDGTSPELIRTNWSAQPPQELWRKPIGQGFSSMAVAGGRIFTLVRRSVSSADREVCIALDPDTGAELWSTDLDAANYTNLSNYDDRMDGPRSTPTVDGEQLYVLTSHLKLFCLGTASGGVVWSRDFRAELGSGLIAWENAASPLLVGDLVFANCNAPGQRLMAVRKSDGVTVWSGQDDIMTHATPVFARIEDVPQMIFLTHSGLAAVVPETGKVLWRLRFTPSSTSTAASPAVAGHYVWASAAYGSGTWAALVRKSGDTLSASEAWRQQGNTYQSHWSTPVVENGFLYGIPSPSSSQARLTCLDVAGGTNRWVQMQVGSGNIGFGSVIKAANALIVLTEAGELVLVQPNPAAYTELAKLKVLDRYCWNHVTLANGRIYARSTSLAPEIVALAVGPSISPLPALALAAEQTRSPSGAPLRLTVRPADGVSALDPNATGQVQVLAATDLAVPLNQWSVVAASFRASNGMWMGELPLGPEPALFLRVLDKTGER